MTQREKGGEFEAVRLDTTFGESDGFYAHYKSIPEARRKLVLVRLPRDVSHTCTGVMSRLQQVV
jgi:hypothetical protein